MKEFIWDFDGMLFDTYPHTVGCFTETLRRQGRNIDPDEAMSLFKVTMKDAFSFYKIDDDTKEAFYELENDIERLPLGVPYEGIPEILCYIVKNGGRNYLFTHRDKVALSYFQKYSLTSYFTDFVLRDMGFPFKPAPDGIEYLINKHSLIKSECIMLGDRIIDVGSGKNAGIKTLLFDEFGNMTPRDADYYARTQQEVSRIIKNIIG